MATGGAAVNPILQSALGSILRWGLAIGAGYLVKAGIWTGSEAETYITAGTLAALTLGWSLWKNYSGRLKLVTALHWADATENQVKAHIAKGGATPPVSSPKDAAPELPPAA